MPRTAPAVEPLAFVEACGRFHEEAGLPRMAGRILGWLLLCERPACSLSELSRALRASKSTVCTAARLLEQAGLVARRSRPGDRNDYVELPEECARRLPALATARIGRLREVAGLGLAALAGAPASRKIRLRSLYDQLAQVEAALPALLERRPRRARRARAGERQAWRPSSS